ncbi:UNVERIFIED_CONTAM: hypothetical protein NCL1_14521 [Trichonephila clavipes]
MKYHSLAERHVVTKGTRRQSRANRESEEITDFDRLIPGFQECDEEDVETWIAGDADCCGFQMLNAVGIVTSVQEESDPVDDEDEDNDENCICTYFAFASRTFPASDDFQYSYSVRTEMDMSSQLVNF